MIFGNIAQGLAYWRFSTRFPSFNVGLHDHLQRAGIRSIVSLPPQLGTHSITEHTPGWYRSCSAFYAWKIISPCISLNVCRILTGLPTHSQYATISRESRQDSAICWLRAHTCSHLTSDASTIPEAGSERTWLSATTMSIAHMVKILSGLFHIDYILKIWDVYMYQGGSSSYYHWATLSRPPFEGPLAFKWVSEDLDVDATFFKTYTLSDCTSRPTTLWYSDYHYRVIVFDCGTPCASLPVSDRPFLNTVPWWLGNNEQQMDNYTAAAGGGPRCMVLD